MENKEYDSKLLDSMEDMYERENELLNKSNEEEKEVENKEEVKKKSKNISKYYSDVKISLIKYKNMMLILIIYVIINLKQFEEFINNMLSKFKLSESINLVLTNILKGNLFLLIIYLLGIKVLY